MIAQKKTTSKKKVIRWMIMIPSPETAYVAEVQYDLRDNAGLAIAPRRKQNASSYY